MVIKSLLFDEFFNSLRTREYQRISSEGHIYLDYAGGNLYAESQLKKHHALLKKNVFGNPHSTNPTSELASGLVSDARNKILEFFNAQEYYCIFTHNATEALKIVGECYPFNQDSHYLLLSDNHNSVNGIREYCSHRNGKFSYAKIRHEDLTIDEEQLENDLNAYDDKQSKLFAFPAQSNVTGVKHDLRWINYAGKKGWDVLLDAAAFVPTDRLDLSEYKPDFVPVSFYKIFGYPTGIGCLLVRKNSFHKLRKRWFAGGTVKLASVLSPSHILADDHERFENGTVNYLDIPAIKIGLDFIENIGLDKINNRISSLRNYLVEEIADISHDSGVKVVKIFGPKDRNLVGGSVIMSFFNPDGSTIAFETIEGLANNEKISIRSGCFCNPGIDEINSCLTPEELTKYFTTRKEGNYSEMIHFLNKMRGATRVSLGIATIQQDLDRYIDFVKSLKNKNI